ncbi:hypothetical protein NAL94_14780 [Vibrio alginolyticus]|nr:hypothetical protein [Vibrio alginolyticus]MCK8113242.1 hypothetical protein [Vibrio sp. 2CM40D]MCG6332435.1 hypothetical protein [Vibrio alginolyticus]MCG6332484.1 hypothetical protein [Vibrio alginolyticus]MCG6336821.1 hypothetical protein [Vibrio alginolyticus]
MLCRGLVIACFTP